MVQRGRVDGWFLVTVMARVVNGCEGVVLAAEIGGCFSDGVGLGRERESCACTCLC